ncbi:transposase [Corynebacterium diphtheriae]|nr:transposase [Corynebacterium diphtheriae]
MRLKVSNKTSASPFCPLSHDGPVTIDVRRDRAGTFLPTMVPKGSRRLTDVDDMIVSLYAGGMTVRDI